MWRVTCNPSISHLLEPLAEEVLFLVGELLTGRNSQTKAPSTAKQLLVPENKITKISIQQ